MSVGPEREQKENSGGKPRVQVAFFPSGFFGDRIFVLCGFLQSDTPYAKRGEGVRENREQNFACCVKNSFPGGNSRDKGFPRVGPGGLAREGLFLRRKERKVLLGENGATATGVLVCGGFPEQVLEEKVPDPG